MRNVILLLLLSITIISKGQEQVEKDSSSSDELIKYLLFDDVSLRSDSNVDSEIIEKLRVGSKLKIIDETFDEYTLNGITDYWYEVVVLDENNNYTNVQGYVWGGMFAYELLNSSNDKEVKFLYGLSRIGELDMHKDSLAAIREILGYDWGYVPIFQIRAINNFQEISRIEFEGIGPASALNGCQLLGNKELRNINEIIHFNFDESMCAGAFGDIYIFWDKAILHHAASYRKGFDAPVFSDKKLIFPDDENGEKGILILYEEAGEYNDDGSSTYEYQRETKLFWTGCELKKLDE